MPPPSLKSSRSLSHEQGFLRQAMAPGVRPNPVGPLPASLVCPADHTYPFPWPLLPYSDTSLHRTCSSLEHWPVFGMTWGLLNTANKVSLMVVFDSLYLAPLLVAHLLPGPCFLFSPCLGLEHSCPSDLTRRHSMLLFGVNSRVTSSILKAVFLWSTFISVSQMSSSKHI